jgi:hypothetical protein
MSVCGGSGSISPFILDRGVKWLSDQLQAPFALLQGKELYGANSTRHCVDPIEKNLSHVLGIENQNIVTVMPDLPCLYCRIKLKVTGN